MGTSPTCRIDRSCLGEIDRRPLRPVTLTSKNDAASAHMRTPVAIGLLRAR